ncbi:hypothetical protein T492DRAFT_833996 [Pavlovales sp. CCMP2436]|nr:hypothetical protein T492DRAFT_833996 [Pavlovales sp. CCMP2436]
MHSTKSGFSEPGLARVVSALSPRDLPPVEMADVADAQPATDAPFSPEEFARVVQSRYSCYAFDAAAPVDDEDPKKCLELTRAAPRFKATRSWVAIVVRSSEGRAKLVDTVDKIHCEKVANAPVCVVFDCEHVQENVLAKSAPEFLKLARPSLMGASAEAWAFIHKTLCKRQFYPASWRFKYYFINNGMGIG